jgi:hypothetical protein
MWDSNSILHSGEHENSSETPKGISTGSRKYANKAFAS